MTANAGTQSFRAQIVDENARRRDLASPSAEWVCESAPRPSEECAMHDMMRRR